MIVSVDTSTRVPKRMKHDFESPIIAQLPLSDCMISLSPGASVCDGTWRAWHPPPLTLLDCELADSGPNLGKLDHMHDIRLSSIFEDCLPSMLR